MQYREYHFSVQRVPAPKRHRGPYEPRIAVVKHLCNHGQWRDAYELAQRIGKDNPQAGIVALDAVKGSALRAELTSYASLAADAAARLVKHLYRG